MLPAIVESVEQLHRTRARLDAALDELLQAHERVDDPVAALNSIPFYLGYAGLNDRPLLEKLAAVHEHLCPSLNFTAPHVQHATEHRPTRGRKTRIGVISTNLFNHTIGKLNSGLIEYLDRSRFEIFILQNGIDDPLANRIRGSADHVIPAPCTFGALRQSIADAHLDVIFYPDIGMVPLTYYLGFARLAPVQCVTWGHPLTTGLRSLDYFLSARNLETGGSSRNIPSNCIASPFPERVTRGPSFNRSMTRRAFRARSELAAVCLSAITVQDSPGVRFAPCASFVKIAQARIVLVAGSQGDMFGALKRRFAKTMAGDVERVDPVA